jgi:Domain of unknown function (DUF4326)
MNSVGSIRVVSKRKGGTAVRSDEIIIDVDRDNHNLGNRYVLKNHKDDEERDRVISTYQVDLENDCLAKGRMFSELLELSIKVSNGEKIALRCWCAPKKCHGDLLAMKIAELAMLDRPEQFISHWGKKITNQESLF